MLFYLQSLGCGSKLNCFGLKWAWHMSIDCAMHLKEVQAAAINKTVVMSVLRGQFYSSKSTYPSNFRNIRRLRSSPTLYINQCIISDNSFVTLQQSHISRVYKSQHDTAVGNLVTISAYINNYPLCYCFLHSQITNLLV